MHIALLPSPFLLFCCHSFLVFLQLKPEVEAAMEFDVEPTQTVVTRSTPKAIFDSRIASADLVSHQEIVPDPEVSTAIYKPLAAIEYLESRMIRLWWPTFRCADDINRYHHAASEIEKAERRLGSSEIYTSTIARPEAYRSTSRSAINGVSCNGAFSWPGRPVRYPRGILIATSSDEAAMVALAVCLVLRQLIAAVI